MKRSIIMLVLVLLVIKTNAQDSSYYYYKGGKISLNQSSNKIAVQLPSDTASRNQFIAIVKSNPNFKFLSPKLTDVNNFGGNYYLIQVVDGCIYSTIDALNFFIAMPFVTYASYSYGITNGKPLGLTNDVIVKLKPNNTSDIVKNLSAKYGCMNIRSDKYISNVYFLTFSKSSVLNTLQIANELFETNNFEYTDPNFITFDKFDQYSTCDGVVDPLFVDQWGLYNQGVGFGGTPSGVPTPGLDINVCNAWATTTGESFIWIGIVDGGVQLDHPDLFPPTGETFCGTSTGGAPGGTTYQYAHGTAVAGIAAALQNNIDVTGVAPSCRLLSAKISDGSTFGTYEQVGNGITYAASMADVLNCSWGIDGGAPSPFVDDAIGYAVDFGRGGLGCAMVFSSGDDGGGTLYYPSNNPSVISVGGVDMCGQRLQPGTCSPVYPGGASNYGTGLSVVAPGASIFTLDLTGVDGYNAASGSAGDFMPNFGATSGAAPFVSGVAALLLSVNPCLRWYEVRDIIQLSATKISPGSYSYSTSTPNGSWDPQVGYGLVNAGNAVTLAHDNYRQNTFETTLQYYLSPHKTFAGNDVTNILPMGNYIVSPGANITFAASESINLEPGFSARYGSIFTGYVNPSIPCYYYVRDFREANPNNNNENNNNITISDDAKSTMKIYPNPAHDILNVSYTLTNNNNMQVDIINTLGQKVQTNNYQGESIGLQIKTLSVNSLVPGNYFIVLKIGDEAHQFKFVKE